MAKIEPTLDRQLRAEPEVVVDLIVRTEGDPKPHLPWLQAHGLIVRQTFRLMPGLALTGPGAEALKLLDQDWVISIELDRPVQAL